MRRQAATREGRAVFTIARTAVSSTSANARSHSSGPATLKQRTPPGSTRKPCPLEGTFSVRAGPA